MGYAGGCGRRFAAPGTVALAIMLLAGTSLLTGSEARAEWRFHPRAGIRAIYDSNLHLITDEDQEVTSARGDPGFPSGVEPVEDFLLELMGGLRADYTLGALSNGFFDAQYLATQHLDEREENTETARLKAGWDVVVNDLVGLELVYGFEKHNQRPGAEYRRPDHLEHDVRATVHFYPTARDQISASFLYENRNYESIDGSAFVDYDAPAGLIGYRRELTDRTTLHLDFYFEDRAFDKNALDELGRPKAGVKRDDDLWEISAALTQVLDDVSVIQGRYAFDHNDSTGEFYRYRTHTVSAIYVRQLPWDVQWRLYAHYRFRDFRDQIAKEEKVLEALNAGMPIPSHEEREDDQVHVETRFGKEIFRNIHATAEYHYIWNGSNDPSSEYDVHRVMLGLLWTF